MGQGLKKLDNGFGEGGDWDLYKCFYNDDKFFININLKTGEGEIVKKDNDFTLEINE